MTTARPISERERIVARFLSTCRPLDALHPEDALRLARHILDGLGTGLFDRPNLGMATTRELLNEIRARIEVDYFAGGGGLDYSTVSGRPDGVLLD